MIATVHQWVGTLSYPEILFYPLAIIHMKILGVIWFKSIIVLKNGYFQSKTEFYSDTLQPPTCTQVCIYWIYNMHDNIFMSLTKDSCV